MSTIVPVEHKESLDLIRNVLFQFGIYKEYTALVNGFKTVLQFFIPNIQIDFKNKQLIVDNITITNEV